MRYDPIPYDHLVIPQGGTFVADWAIDDATTGEPAVWTGWSGRMQIRDNQGGLIATLANTGTRDGDLTFGDNGNLTATLTDEFTGGIAEGSGVFDLLLTDPDGAAWRVVSGSVHITPEVTTDA